MDSPTVDAYQGPGVGARKLPAIGIFSKYLASAHYGALISTITRSAWAQGWRVVTMQTARPAKATSTDVAAKSLARVGWDRLAGFIALGAATPSGYLADLRRAGKPVVVVGNEKPGLSCPVVISDNRGGIRQAVEHLVGHGHTLIAFVGCLDQFETQERYDSYCRTLTAYGVRPDSSLVFEAPDNIETGGLDAGRRMVSAGLPSTAVVVATDLNAVGVMKALVSAGYVLPRDQAVTGFDNALTGVVLTPSLSSVSQDTERLGTLALELLLRQLTGEEVAGRHLVDARFVQRESCGCVSRATPVALSGPQDWRDPVFVFCRAMGASGECEPHVVELANEVARAFLAAASARSGPSTVELDRLSDACAELYRCKPEVPTQDLVWAMTDHLMGQLQAAAGEDRAALAGKLNLCRAYVRLGLSRAVLAQRDQEYYDLRRLMRDEHLVTMDLLASREEGDSRLLTWLSRTGAVAGLLALWEGPGDGLGQGVADGQEGQGWRPPQPGGALLATSTFLSPGEGLDLAAPRCPVESFPPDELLGLVSEGSIVAVLTVASDEADWGLLAMVADVGSVCTGQNTTFMWAALFAEVLDHVALTRSLRQSEERYALAAQAANDGLWDWDVRTGQVYYSARWKEMLGLPAGAVTSQPDEWLERVHPDDRPTLLAALSELKLSVRDKVLFEHRLQAGDGSYLWVLCRALAVPGRGVPATRLIGSITDVTERRMLEDQLRHQALYDSLTGLPNRVLFVDRLSQAISSAKRNPAYYYAVLWLDLDNFKDLNDSQGHLAGDQLLVQVADRVRANLRGVDTAARFGGDEFAVLLLDVTDLVAVQAVTRRLLADLREPYRIDGYEFVVTGSVGVVMGSSRYEYPEDVLRDADIAMYRAKAAGRGTFATF
jgi:diguanylate cyclase (GGDEF)-like protein/PAS domain S-box-containing protein